ncbi:L-aspartate oxidase [Agrobacterium vitis]|uniref:L-aspartate oxidase n=1 Tax=Rhizobium/Agrobacterium group TaxID=227290 RepID=UPI0008DC288B|nr:MULTISPECIES: L-aspartate oxidase [Rhizobium/Agrobacterium group]MCF1433254.1 L-aspartate oxidase [Allorhizobium ampelinum]MUO90891.1 L-aspartate oxidase [Agrobacterium vitis]MUZ54819.1 L-aspartate oxidase [Agrobacterium vitis]MUZ93091.1 L-aspartate oxidase [Agrobacterium vitis]MVA41386.1 L-aspartate oxidase [Agrobacterium vitis]
MMFSDGIEDYYDVLVIGAGLAGQTLALSVAREKRVLIVCKSDLGSAASNYAQGGISAVYAADDTHDKHVSDTLIAGCHLNDIDNTRYIVENGRKAVEWLIEQGVPFTKQDGDYHLTREGGHGERRILHVDDMTGRGIQTSLSSHLLSHPNITVLENCAVTDLIRGDAEKNTCIGAVLIDPKGVERRIASSFTVLATGGVGPIFSHTTSPAQSIGDGIPLAWRMGCRVANLEFMQFHPTCMYYPGGDAFLITEAVRGEGGILTLPDGYRFMADYDERAELAPRDVVSRAIYSEMKKNGIPSVNLDISHKPAEFIKGHFPNIYQKCLERGIDMTKEPIPVTPASHYTCGGVYAEINGRTDVDRLYCLGEAAYTGLHGANRLASNSLLECVVMARAASLDILSGSDLLNVSLVPAKQHPHIRAADGMKRDAMVLIKQEIRTVMWNYVGIVRSQDSLHAARRRIDLLHSEVEAMLTLHPHSFDLSDLHNMVVTARIVIDSALSRSESRGCHYNSDFPNSRQESGPTVLCLADQHASVAA